MNDLVRYRREFEERGEAVVRDQLERGLFNPFKAGVARSWLNELDRQKADAHIEDEANDRRSALRIARQANWVSLGALLVAVVALGVSWLG